MYLRDIITFLLRFMAKMILIVEDCADTREFMRFLLERYGYEVVEAIDGLEAVEKFKTAHPDLILMDISLPMVDGLTATRAIREMLKDKHIPIIALTAFGSLYLEKALQAGVDELMNKPLNLDLFETALKKYLER